MTRRFAADAGPGASPVTRKRSAPRSCIDREIDEQPAAVGRLVDRAAAEIAALRAVATGITGLTVIAHGSADHGAHYAQHVVPLRSGVPTTIAASGRDAAIGRVPRLVGQLVLALVPSGRSTDVTRMVVAARESARPVVVLTDDVTCPLAATADHVIDLASGGETSVGAIAASTCTLVALAVVATALASRSDDAAALSELDRLPHAMTLAHQLADRPAVATADAMRDARRIVTVGSGPPCRAPARRRGSSPRWRVSPLWRRRPTNCSAVAVRRGSRPTSPCCSWSLTNPRPG